MIVPGQGSPSARLEKARSCLQHGLFDEAEALYAGVLADGIETAPILVNLATCLKRNGRWDEALDAFEQAFRLRRLARNWSDDAGSSEPVRVSVLLLRHLAEQLGYLKAAGLLPGYQTEVLTALAQAEHFVASAYGPRTAGPLPTRLETLLRPWLTGCAVYDVPDAGPSPLGPDLRIERIGLGPDGACCYVLDDVLSEQALSALRQFLVRSTIWYDARPHGSYLGAHLHDGLANSLTRSVLSALHAVMTRLIGPTRLIQAWAFKCAAHADGIDLHADQADWNLNFWPMADSCNLEPGGGGLCIGGSRVPASWSFADYNPPPGDGAARLRDLAGPLMTVGYRGNRAVLFPSAHPHRSAPVNFRPDYEARRVNITLMADAGPV